MREGAVLFGATILGRGVAPNLAARKLLDLYNAKGVFNNREDDFKSLSEGLRRRFGEVEVERQGCVALFRALGRPSDVVLCVLPCRSRLGMVINPPLTLPSFASVHR